MKKNRSISNSPRLNELKKKRKRTKNIKILFFIFAIAIIIYGLTYLSRIPKINIDNITATGNKTIDVDDIKEIVNSDLSGYYLWLFPKTNFLFFPKHKIENDLSIKFKRAKNISVNIKGTRSINIDLSERVATYIWCGETPTADTTKCYFMDDSGYIFDNAPSFSGNVYFKFFGKVDTDSSGSVSGSYYMNNDFNKLLSLKSILENMGLKISSLFVKDNNDAEFYLASATPLPDAPKIMFRTDADFDNLAENLQAALTTEPLKTDFATKYSSLLFINLSIGNKIYYKFK